MDGVGGLLLLAGASETGVLTTLEQAVASFPGVPGSRLARLQPVTRAGLLRTLLFLTAVGLRRPWDLRAYSGDALAVLTGRPRAYGYRTVERFLRELATADGAGALTDALGSWATRLWHAERPRVAGTPPPFYIDGHRKAVYSDVLLPRGLVGHRGAVLGCRALILLHDAAGHPLFATTQRGDTHLTVGVPAFLARYEAHNPPLPGFIVDREGMAAAFLAHLAGAGQQVVTLLRRDQYEGLSSFPSRWTGRSCPGAPTGRGHRFRRSRPHAIACIVQTIPMSPSSCAWRWSATCARAGPPRQTRMRTVGTQLLSSRQPRHSPASYPSSRRPRSPIPHDWRPPISAAGQPRRTASRISCSPWGWTPTMATVRGRS